MNSVLNHVWVWKSHPCLCEQLCKNWETKIALLTTWAPKSPGQCNCEGRMNAHSCVISSRLPHPSLRTLGAAATEGWWHCSPGGSFLASTRSTPRLSHTLHMLLTFQSISKPINFSAVFHRGGAQLRTGIFFESLEAQIPNRVWSILNLESSFPGQIFNYSVNRFDIGCFMI